MVLVLSFSMLWRCGHALLLVFRVAPVEIDDHALSFWPNAPIRQTLSRCSIKTGLLTPLWTFFQQRTGANGLDEPDHLLQLTLDLLLRVGVDRRRFQR